MSKKFSTITEARKNLFKIADEIQKPNTYYILTIGGKPQAVLMSYSEFDSIMETIEVMRDFPDLEKDVKETEKEYRNGEYKKYKTFEEILAKEGFVLADASENKYGISPKVQIKSRKRTGKNSSKK